MKNHEMASVIARGGLEGTKFMIFRGARSKNQPKSTFSVTKSIKSIPTSQKNTSLHSSEGGECWFAALQKISDFGVVFSFFFQNVTSERLARLVAENVKK